MASESIRTDAAQLVTKTNAKQPTTEQYHPVGAEQPGRKKRARCQHARSHRISKRAPKPCQALKKGAGRGNIATFPAALNSPLVAAHGCVTCITTLEDCATWMSSFTTHEANEPLRRLSEALHVLHAQPSRPRRCQIQSMLKSWDVPQKDKSGAKIRALHVEAMLTRKVIDEARRLKTLHDVHGSSSAISLTLGRSP